MSIQRPKLLLALGQSGWEADIVTSVVAGIPAAQVHRCVDVSSLVVEAKSTPVQLVVLDAAFPRLDSAIVAALEERGINIVGLSADVQGISRLEALGVTTVVPVSPGDPGAAVGQLRDRWVGVATGDGVRHSAVPSPEVNLRSASGRLIAVWGPPGAPGRTTIAITLSQLLAEAADDVLLVDADTTAPGVGPALCIEAEGSGLIAACHHGERGTLDVEVLARLARSVDDRFRVLTGVSHVSRRVELRAAAMSKVWQVATRLGPTCVVDIGGCIDDGSLALDANVADFGINSSGHTAAVTALAAADELVAVTTCEPTAISRLLSHVSSIRSLAPSSRLHVVINRVRSPVVRNQAAADELRSFVQAHTKADQVVLVREDRQAVDSAIARGLTPVECNQTSDFVNDVRGLTHHLASPLVAAS